MVEPEQPTMPPTPSRFGGRIPSLDGIRAISIGLVIFSHLAGTHHFPVRWSIFSSDLGMLGVRVFFVISGFLITTLLLEEYADSGGISLPWFYFRRTLRIFPAAYAFIAVIFILHGLDLVSLQSRDMLHALTYTMNYSQDSFHRHSWTMYHLWSLSVEEQFYLLWPAALALLGPAMGLRLAIGAILAAPLFRAATWILFPDWRGYLPYSFPTVCDSLAAGCVLALVRGRLEQWPGYARWLASRVALMLPFAIVGLYAVMEIRWHGLRLFRTVGETLLFLLIALEIHRAVYVHTDGIGRLLNWRPCRYVGRLSYSLYIWQEVFLDQASTSLLAAFPVNLLCVAATGMASYYLVESPFLALRSRLEGAWRGTARPSTRRAGARPCAVPQAQEVQG